MMSRNLGVGEESYGWEWLWILVEQNGSSNSL
jgi:hypothetical protein